MALTAEQKREKELKKRFQAESKDFSFMALPQAQVAEKKEELEGRGYESVVGHALRTEGSRVASLVVTLGL